MQKKCGKFEAIPPPFARRYKMFCLAHRQGGAGRKFKRRNAYGMFRTAHPGPVGMGSRWTRGGRCVFAEPPERADRDSPVDCSQLPGGGRSGTRHWGRWGREYVSLRELRDRWETQTPFRRRPGQVHQEAAHEDEGDGGSELGRHTSTGCFFVAVDCRRLGW